MHLDFISNIIVDMIWLLDIANWFSLFLFLCSWNDISHSILFLAYYFDFIDFASFVGAFMKFITYIFN